MSLSKASLLYANSLYDLAIEKNVVAGITGEIANVAKVIAENSELKRVVESPIVKQSAKLEILKEILSSDATPVFMQFLQYLGKKNRIDGLLEISKAYLQVHDERQGILRVKLTSAFPVNEEQLTQIRLELESQYKKTILFETKINATVIGGFVLQIDDTIIDASLKNKLELLKKKFLKASISLN
jgi:F-type H+-transporting ATPase subunit delta